METEFNWYTELDKAIKQEPSEATYLDLKRRAYEWVTCACGQLCKALPRNCSGEPYDLKLTLSGIYFTKCIISKKWHKSLKVLNQIEARTAELLQEINTKQN